MTTAGDDYGDVMTAATVARLITELNLLKAVQIHDTARGGEELKRLELIREAIHAWNTTRNGLTNAQYKLLSSEGMITAVCHILPERVTLHMRTPTAYGYDQGLLAYAHVEKRTNSGIRRKYVNPIAPKRR